MEIYKEHTSKAWEEKYTKRRKNLKQNKIGGRNTIGNIGSKVLRQGNMNGKIIKMATDFRLMFIYLYDIRYGKCT